MSSIVKLAFNSDLRRVRLEEAACRSFASLLHVIRTTFPELHNPGLPVCVQYEDDESELVTVGSDEELQEAFAVARGCARPSLRFIVSVKSERAPTAPVPEASKRVKVEEEASSAASPPAVPATPPPTPQWSGVPADKMATLISLLKQEAALNPMALLPLTSLMTDVGVIGLFGRVMTAAPDLPRMLELASKDPVLLRVLLHPSVRPFLAPAGIEVSEADVPAATAAASASAPSLSTPGASIAAMLPALMQQFSGLGLDVVSACVGESEPAVPATAGEVPAESAPIHARVRCDGCNVFPVVGARHKCTVCSDFDLCGACYEVEEGHRSAHAFEEVPAAPFHQGVTCDGCDMAPITGTRFKCAVCPNYDLCEGCEAKGAHTHHALLKLRDPSLTPASLIAILRPDQHVGAPAEEATGHRVWSMHRGGQHGRGRQWGCGAGHRRKHDRSWSFPRQPRVEAPLADPEVQKVIEESLRMVSGGSTPAPEPKAAVATHVVKQDEMQYNARFITHITLTDAAPVGGGSKVVKTWRMRNDGDAAWPVGTLLVHVGAETLGCPESGVPVPLAAPGEAVDVSVPLTAPSVPGRHVGYFRLVTGEGVRFGHRIWADLFVENSNAKAVVAAVAASPVSTPTPVATPVATPVPAASPVAVKPEAVAAVPEVVPVPSAPALPVAAPVVEVPVQWQSQLIAMAEMGFFDIASNIAALEACRGDVARAVEALLAAM